VYTRRRYPPSNEQNSVSPKAVSFSVASIRATSSCPIVFAEFVSDQRDHLARQRVADLFLDTLPHNTHTTAADALWVGVPVLTCVGSTFPGRVAASLLRAIALSELITHSLAEYEVGLARDPTLLFDTPRFARNIERAY
jgi:protein O-GlcNAc transferase